MKIEIGESLIYSYLRQEKKCLVTQINWKASGNWDISEHIRDSVSYEFDKIKNHHAFSGMFKTDFNQTLKQAEIDVLGVSGDNRVYAFEVAFHGAGLNYGSKIETRNRVFKKLLRGYLTLKYYFPIHHHIIAFCSPKVNNATQAYIEEYFEVLNSEFSDEDVTFEYYSNERFNEEILQKTLEKTTNEADSSELFSRAVKLLKLSEGFSHPKVPNRPRPIPEPIKTISDDEENNFSETVDIQGFDIPTSPVNSESVQDYVKRVMQILLHNNLLSYDEIRRLQKQDYSKRVIGIEHALLLPTTEDPRDNAGHPRYWKREIFGDFYICSEWWLQHRLRYLTKIKSWLHTLENQNNLAA